ncbi:dedicator of cytokinesis protein 2-like isoform X1 [Sycon ciliatum]|uniref:dedicator of cytokinesis protein 2-like isoform X1 n=1 Tax=Sycon ciliatum TaxID=27933 RepID=UPI0031F686C2
MSDVWRPTTQAKLGVAIYNYDPVGKGPEFLKLDLGDQVQIQEQCAGWYRGFALKTRQKGIFPASFIHLKEATVKNPGPNEVVEGTEDLLAQELTQLLPEWGELWQKRYFMEDRYGMFVTIRKVITELIDIRKQVLASTLPLDDMKKLKLKASGKIDWGNKHMGLDLVPRNEDGQSVDEADVSIVALHKMHLRSTQRQIDTSERGTVIRRGKFSQNRLSELLHHVHFCMQAFICNVGEESEMQVALYDNQEGRYFSERFVEKINRHGMPTNLNHLNNICCLFTDLGNSDLKREEAYLVCKIIRIGRMIPTVHVKDPKEYRRPYGCAVLNIAQLLKSSRDTAEDTKECQLDIYGFENEGDFAELHTHIIKKNNSKIKPLQTDRMSAKIHVSVRLLHGSMAQVKEENPLLFRSSDVPVARKLGFPDVIMPGDHRNDLYITLVSGDFQRDGKKAHKNVEVEVCVVSENGRVLDNAIVSGVSSEKMTLYRGVVLYHLNTPVWEDVIKFDIPFDQFYTSHLRFTFYHRPKDPSKSLKHGFSLAYVPLMQEDGTTLRDSTHKLFMYKCEGSVHKNLDPNIYIKLPWQQSEFLPPLPIKGSISYTGRESFEIRTLVCSTKLTQNVDLLGLLKWRQQPDRLEENLKGLMRVSGEEIVKFLRDTFDALFAILDEDADRSGKLVFQCLVFIIRLLGDRKFEHFRSVLDAYIQTHFSGAMAHKKLIEQLKCCLEEARVQTSTEHNNVRVMQALQYIFKFIIKSRLLFARATRGKGAQPFKESLCELFDSFNHLMEVKDESLLAIQAAGLQHFSAIIQEVLKIMEPDEFAVIIKQFIDSVPKNRLVRFKLLCLGHIVNNDIFRHEECRHILMPMLGLQLASHVKGQSEDQLPKCFEILGEVLILLQRRDVGKTFENITEIVNLLLIAVLNRVTTIEKTSTLWGHVVACFVAILSLMSEKHFHSFLRNFPSKDGLVEFLRGCFEAFYALVTTGSFPSDWSAMISVLNNTITISMKFFSESLQTQFQRGQNFNESLWKLYFDVCIAFVTQGALQLETFTASKRNKQMAVYGDLRLHISQRVLSMWNSLATEQKQLFLPWIVGPFMDMSLIREHEIRCGTIPVFYDLMVCEFVQTGDYRQVSAECIDKLDVHVSGAGKGDDAYMDLLYPILSGLCNKNRELMQAGALEFVENLTQLLGRLLDFRNLQDGDEYSISRMQTIFNLLQYYQETEREEMVIRYIYKLSSLHLQAQNYSEAAFSLLLHTSILKWEDLPVSAHGEFPSYAKARSEYELKELIFKDIIEYFDKGKLWECAIPLCKELALQCEMITFDYEQLSGIHKTISKLYHDIMHSVRGKAEYYRVGFYGTLFPPFLRNKQFIFRGKDFERLGEFNQMLLSHFPKAQLITFNTPPGEEYNTIEGMHMQVSKVEPIADDVDKFAGMSVASSIIDYYAANNISHFVLNRPVRRGPKSAGEFATMWVERTVYMTASRLPGMLRWCEVVDEKRLEISPIENALETMVSKNKELRALSLRAQKNPAQLNPLSMALNGVLDAAVQGGLANYENLFFTEEYAREHPEHILIIDEIKDLIKEQVIILGEGLDVHQKLAPEALSQFHKRMEECYEQMRSKYLPQAERRGQPTSASSSSGSRTPERSRATMSIAGTPTSQSITSGSPSSRRSMFYVNAPAATTSPTSSLTPSISSQISRGRMSSASLHSTDSDKGLRASGLSRLGKSPSGGFKKTQSMYTPDRVQSANTPSPSSVDRALPPPPTGAGLGVRADRGTSIISPGIGARDRAPPDPSNVSPYSHPPATASAGGVLSPNGTYTPLPAYTPGGSAAAGARDGFGRQASIGSVGSLDSPMAAGQPPSLGLRKASGDHQTPRSVQAVAMPGTSLDRDGYTFLDYGDGPVTEDDINVPAPPTRRDSNRGSAPTVPAKKRSGSRIHAQPETSSSPHVTSSYKRSDL